VQTFQKSGLICNDLRFAEARIREVGLAKGCCKSSQKENFVATFVVYLCRISPFFDKGGDKGSDKGSKRDTFATGFS